MLKVIVSIAIFALACFLAMWLIERKRSNPLNIKIPPVYCIES
ncbi:hypothetical protein [Helicobacter cinaedi]|uniref:Uncharacterized protein n=1 Tax=Helicobacter cinaedi TaxID=213 RepID=A0A377JLC8_9HELI|nr:hypothetical protein [Helicobacter cinaedi]STP08591.1 Uncharacterised protein [Helicobacter cinaedi]